MKCEKCTGSLSYGDKYCTHCGDKISEEVYQAEYEGTIWAKFDKAKDRYDTFFLKKITGSTVFKTIWMIIVLGFFFFTMYGNLNGIRLKDSQHYKIQYFKSEDAYCIKPVNEEANLQQYAPIGTDSIVFTAVKDGVECDKKEFTPKQYQEQGYAITAGEYESISVDAVRNGKTVDKIKIMVYAMEGKENEECAD